MVTVEKLLKNYKLEQLAYYPLVHDGHPNLNAQSLKSFTIGDMVVDVYRSQVYILEGIAEWAVLRHVATKNLSCRSLCDNHFEKVKKSGQLTLF